jgi:hypothetical protein
MLNSNGIAIVVSMRVGDKKYADKVVIPYSWLLSVNTSVGETLKRNLGRVTERVQTKILDHINTLTKHPDLFADLSEGLDNNERSTSEE